MNPYNSFVSLFECKCSICGFHMEALKDAGEILEYDSVILNSKKMEKKKILFMIEGT